MNDTHYCGACKRDRKTTYFYKTNNEVLGNISPICKSCIKENVDENNLESVLKMLQQLDIMFDPEWWETAKKNKKDTFGIYIKNANSMRQFNGKTYKDSILTSVKDNEDTVNQRIHPSSFVPTDEIYDKWGFGFTNEEYCFFEKKEKQLSDIQRMKNTDIYFMDYIKYQVKAEMAQGKNNAKDMETFSKLAKQAADTGMFSPEKIAKSNLLDGINSFGELSKSVERVKDVIEILPKYLALPQDNVDFTIWCYINYNRDMLGMPLIKYYEVYAFIEERRQEYLNLINNDDLYNIEEVDEEDEL